MNYNKGVSGIQLIIMVVFCFAIVIAVLMFSGILPGFGGGGSGTPVEEVVFWSPFNNREIGEIISDFNNQNEDIVKIKYVVKDSETYDADIINSLASGVGPDLWFVRQDSLLKNKNKLYTIPFASFSERDFLNIFVDTAQVFLDKGENGGVAAVPFMVDPMVMFWNRSLFSSAGIAQYPKYWDEFLTASQALTKRDGAGNIVQSGAALGGFNNINNAKGILSMLILQTGNPIVDSRDLKVYFGDKGTSKTEPVETTLNFFNQFSKIGFSSYSWNRALLSSGSSFTNGTLAMYFGYGSEVSNIKLRNPHLSFDISEVPQVRVKKEVSGLAAEEIKTTHSMVYAIGVSKNSTKKQSAFLALTKLMDPDFNKTFSESLGFASARRDVLSVPTEDPYYAVINKSAIMSKTWLEPEPNGVTEIFKNMVESVISDTKMTSSAVSTARNQIMSLLQGR